MTFGTPCLFIDDETWGILNDLGLTDGWISGSGGYYHLIDPETEALLNGKEIAFSYAPYIRSTYSAGTGGN